jgi:hypothetical protein
MAEHSETAQHVVETAIDKLTFAECQDVLRKGKGQWDPVQDAWEIANDEALIANGRIAKSLMLRAIRRSWSPIRSHSMTIRQTWRERRSSRSTPTQYCVN